MTARRYARRLWSSAGRALGRITVRNIVTFALTAVTLAAAVVALAAEERAARWTALVIGVAAGLGFLVVAARAVVARRGRHRAAFETLRAVLTGIVQDDSHPFEEELKIVYTVGATGKDDRVNRHMRTRSKPGGRVHWRTVSERMPQREGARLTPRAVRFQVSDVKAGEASAVGLNSDKNALRVLVAFFPPITRTFVTWSVSYDWPGVWDPLRKTGKDSQSLTLPRKDWRKVEVVFDFPPGTEAVGFTRCPPGGRQSRSVEGERIHLRWRSDPEPAPGKYDFEFAAVLPGRRANGA